MTSTDEVKDAIQRMVEKIKDPKMQKRFTDFNRTLLMIYTDLGLTLSVIFDNGNALVTEGSSDTSDMKVTTDSTTILGILDGSISAMKAFMTGKIKADGSTRDLMKLQHLLKV
jgi:putative sterol carrier protein